MKKPKAPTVTVTSFADYDVIEPPHTLKKAVTTHRPGANEPDPVEQAEQALAAIAHEFNGWMQSECERLDAARRAFLHERTSVQAKALFAAAHDIRGQAETFGFPLVTPVADSLCRIVEYTADPVRIPVHLVDQHVDAVRAIVNEKAGKKSAKALELADRLREVSDDYLAAENRDRADVLEILFGPPLAPTG